MHVLEQLLAELKQESCVFARLDAAEPFRIEKGSCDVAPFYIVLSGRVRIVTAANSYILGASDFLVVPNGVPHAITGMGSRETGSVKLMSLFADAGVPPWAPSTRFRTIANLQHGGLGSHSILLVGIFAFGDPRKNPLLAAFPDALLSRSSDKDRKSFLGSFNHAIIAELGEQRPGGNILIARLADLLFIQAIRDYLTSGDEKSAGWMRGITDPMVGQAISLMHAKPGRTWTLQNLAAQVGSSRAVFAKRFSTLVGQGALGYLTAWRMHIAAGLLLNNEGSVASIAEQVGYRSEAAFATAFKRAFSMSPRTYRRTVS